MFDKDSVRAKKEREFSESIKHYLMEDFRALCDLMLLLEENNEIIDPAATNTQEIPQKSSPPTMLSQVGTTSTNFNKFKPKSQRFPDLSTNP